MQSLRDFRTFAAEILVLMRKILLLFLAAVLCGSTMTLASCAGCDDNAVVVDQPTIARIQNRGTILIGTTGDYRPLTFREADGTYWGFGIDMAGEIAKRLGVGIEFVQTSWPTLSADVQAEPQTFDLAIGGITITDARRETMLMSDGYLHNGKTILCRASEADRYKTLADIDKPEVRVMVNPGRTEREICQREPYSRHNNCAPEERGDTIADSRRRGRRDDNGDYRSTLLYTSGHTTGCTVNELTVY